MAQIFLEMYLVCLELDRVSWKLVGLIKPVSMNLHKSLPRASIRSLLPIPGNNGVLAMIVCLENIKDVAQMDRPDFILVEALHG